MKFCISALLISSICFVTGSALGQVVDFEELPLEPDSFFNGGPETNSDGWLASLDGQRQVQFGNSFNSAFGGFWNGFSYSNVVDTTTPGFENQYAAFPGSGAQGSETYAVAFAGSNAFINLEEEDQRFTSIELTNTTFTALAIENGDAFSNRFGGESGNDPDFFSVLLTGFDELDGTGNATGQVEYFLADYRFDDNSLDFIIDQWNTLSLEPLGAARSLAVSFRSSDVGPFGINTPTYFALDNLTITSVPEPAGFVCALSMSLFCLAGRRRRKI